MDEGRRMKFSGASTRDLSDVIRDAVGGHLGEVLDNAIDSIRIYLGALNDTQYTDTEVVQTAIYALLNIINNDSEYTLLLRPNATTIGDALTTLQREFGKFFRH